MRGNREDVNTSKSRSVHLVAKDKYKIKDILRTVISIYTLNHFLRNDLSSDSWPRSTGRVGPWRCVRKTKAPPNDAPPQGLLRQPCHQ